MTKIQGHDTTENPFKRVLDDAGRRLKDIEGTDILDELPESSEHSAASVPFPYGPQPEHRQKWR